MVPFVSCEMNNQLVRITNGGVEARILLDVGGRIVSYNRIGCPNMLESDPSMWVEEDRLIPSPEMLDFRGYNGHEVWIGPQSQWWKQQTLNKEKIDSDLFWPPDPYISFGSYQIEEQTDSSLTIVGEASPISGLQMRKKMSLDESGCLLFEVEAKNVRETPVSWDLWLITRVNGHNENYVPVSFEKDVWLGEPSHPWQGNPTYKVENGYASFTPLVNDHTHEECTGKLYIKTDKPVIYAKCGEEWLKLEFEHHDPSLLHPEQTEIELYNFVHAEREKSLLELEYHAPYKTLQPGESMSTWSKWRMTKERPF